jgi:SAM-dependent methyltransferase
MSLRAALLFSLSRRLLPSPALRTVDFSAYARWREASLSASWQSFADEDVAGRDVLDFGCGDGELGLYLARTKSPRTIVGIDLNEPALERARAALAAASESIPRTTRVEFRQGTELGMPVPDESIDTLVAFDCLEHVMAPAEIFREWFRVLRPGGKALLEWYPFKGPWGPHMEALIPVPWAHVLFGERAMFAAAARIYDLPQFVARHWDLHPNGKKKPNKWRQWSTFREQGYVNQLDVPQFKTMAEHAGFIIGRLERRSFSGPAWRKAVGRALAGLPYIGDYFVSYTIIEMIKPRP